MPKKYVKSQEELDRLVTQEQLKSEPTREEWALHEAGHVAALVLLGFRDHITGIEILPWPLVRHMPLLPKGSEDTPKVQEVLEKVAVIKAAGVASTQLILGRGEVYGDDLEKLDVRVARSGRNLQSYLDEATVLIRPKRKQIRALAKAIMAVMEAGTESMTREEVLAAWEG